MVERQPVFLFRTVLYCSDNTLARARDFIELIWIVSRVLLRRVKVYQRIAELKKRSEPANESSKLFHYDPYEPLHIIKLL